MSNYAGAAPSVVPDFAGSVRAPIGTGSPASVAIVTAAGAVRTTDPLVFRVTSIATVSTIAATITDDTGSHGAYSNGFVGGYAGSVLTITGGHQITINAPGGGWDPGPFVLSVTAA